MEKTTSMTNIMLNGSAAAAQTAVYSLMATYSQLSLACIALRQMASNAMAASGQDTASSIEKGAQQQASQMRDQAIGGFILGGVELTGIGVAAGYEYKSSSSLSDMNDELKSLKEYRSAAEDRVNELKVSTAPETPQSQELADEMKKLNETDTYRERDLENDQKAINTAPENEVKDLISHLDDLIKSTEDNITNTNSRMNRRSTQITQGMNALGQIGNSTMTALAANHTAAAGKYRAAETLFQTTTQLDQQIYNTASQNSSKYFDLELQLPQIITSLREADATNA